MKQRKRCDLIQPSSYLTRCLTVQTLTLPHSQGFSLSFNNRQQFFFLLLCYAGDGSQGFPREAARSQATPLLHFQIGF